MGALQIIDKPATTSFSIYLLCILFMIIPFGCDNGTGHNTPSESFETASAEFSVRWHNAPPTPDSDNIAVVKAISEDCAANGIVTVMCKVYDDADITAPITSESWPCYDGGGTVNWILPGENRRFVILGLDENDRIVHHGQTNGITIAPGETADVGTIDAFPFIPSGLMATGISDRQINLSWDLPPDNGGTAGYQIFRDTVDIGASTSSAFSDIGLEPLTEYCYTVSAHDEFNNISAQSQQVCAPTTNAEPPTLSAENLIMNPDATLGLEYWIPGDDAVVENQTGSDPYFALRNGGTFHQQVTISTDAIAEPYVLLIARVSSERINADNSITGLPLLWGYARQGETILAYFTDTNMPNMLCNAAVVDQWVAAWGIFPVPTGTDTILFFLKQAEQDGDPQNGSAARFDDVGLYITENEVAAEQLVAEFEAVFLP